MAARPLISEALPGLAAELNALLTADGRGDLAEQITQLRIVDRCRCEDDFCGTFYTVARPSGSWGPGHETIPLDGSASGMINLDLVDGRIVEVEVLFRDEIRKALKAAIP